MNATNEAVATIMHERLKAMAETTRGRKLRDPDKLQDALCFAWVAWTNAGAQATATAIVDALAEGFDKVRRRRRFSGARRNDMNAPAATNCQALAADELAEPQPANNAGFDLDQLALTEKLIDAAAALLATNGQVNDAADILGVNRRTVYNRKRELRQLVTSARLANGFGYYNPTLAEVADELAAELRGMLLARCQVGEAS